MCCWCHVGNVQNDELDDMEAEEEEGLEKEDNDEDDLEEKAKDEVDAWKYCQHLCFLHEQSWFHTVLPLQTLALSFQFIFTALR